jgi:hypothetical protein
MRQHHRVDCRDGSVTLVPFTAKEEKARDAEEQAVAKAAAEADAAREADLAVVREAAKTDPRFAALARLARIG